MNTRCKNGFLVQHLYDCPYGMENIINTCGYNGLSARNSNPLSALPDQESQELSKEAEWHVITEQEHVLLEFISDPNVLLRYIKTCQKHNIPIRLLFVESDYSEEVWTGPDMPKRFLGYEYNSVPIDNQIITDLSWYPQLSPFLERVNSMGLFSSVDDIMLFKTAYDQAVEQGEIGDGDMETYIFCLFEIHVDDVLRAVAQETVCVNPNESRRP